MSIAELERLFEGTDTAVVRLDTWDPALLAVIAPAATGTIYALDAEAMQEGRVIQIHHAPGIDRTITSQRPSADLLAWMEARGLQWDQSEPPRAGWIPLTGGRVLAYRP